MALESTQPKWNEYQASPLADKGSRCVEPRTFPPWCADCLQIPEAWTCWSSRSLFRSIQEQLFWQRVLMHSSKTSCRASHFVNILLHIWPRSSLRHLHFLLVLAAWILHINSSATPAYNNRTLSAEGLEGHNPRIIYCFFEDAAQHFAPTHCTPRSSEGTL